MPIEFVKLSLYLYSLSRRITYARCSTQSTHGVNRMVTCSIGGMVIVMNNKHYYNNNYDNIIILR